jgi:regulator of nucleoside diphosphate kinase
MKKPFYELVLSAADAEVLALMLGERRHASPLEAAAARQLADLLGEARLLPHAELPEDRVAMNSVVTYREEPDGALRTVALVHPIESDASRGRISVLSPIGLALLGRGRGTLVDAALPDARVMTIRILETVRRPEALAA